MQYTPVNFRCIGSLVVKLIKKRFEHVTVKETFKDGPQESGFRPTEAHGG